jgi:DNA-binding SARP family transcriptional activator
MVRVRLLGGLVVEDVSLARTGSRKARRLLARLAVARGGPVGADALAEVVWGDDQPSQPADQLSVLVSRLRSTLGADRLTRTPAGYVLHTDWLDLAALAELAAEARRRLDTGAIAPATAAARAALDLIRGPVLPEEPDDPPWLEADRVAAVRHGAQARLVAAEAALATGDPWTAIGHAERGLEIEPYDEAALRVLMAAHEAAGRPALALRAYAELAERLRDELGADPSPPTRALHLRLLRGEPVAPRERADPGPTPPGGPTRFSGRDKDLAVLAAALERAAAGRTEFVVVEGEAGIGKTRLLTEFLARPPGRGPAVLRCRADEHAGGLPLQPLLDALATRLRAGDRHGADDADELLAGPAALLRGLLGPVGHTTAAPYAAPDAGLATVFAAYDTVIGRLAAAGPLILTVDDVQWADPASRARLHHAARRLSPVPLLILAAQRSGEGEAVHADTVLRLGPLDRSAAAAMLGLAESAPALERLHERSGGHPLFLRELARAGAGELPASIRESISERANRAGPAVAATLRAAAVLGPDVDLELLAAVLDAPVTALLDHLEDAVRRQLLVESGVGFGFAHELVRDALRTGTGAARVVLLHRQAARILAGRANADPLAAAHHARLGGDPATAATVLARAGELAAGRFDLAEAQRLLDEAVAQDDRTDLRVRRARIRLRRTDLAGAAEDSRVVRERADPDEDDYAAALELAALVAYLQRDFERGFRLAEEGAAVARDPEVRASCLGLAGRIRHGLGDLPEARERLDRAGAAAPASIAPVLDLWRGFLLVHSDDPARALRLVEAEEPAQIRVGYPFATPGRHQVAGHARALLGEPVLALAEFDRMATAAERESAPRFAGRVDNFRAWILRNLGLSGPADEANQRAFEQSDAHGLAEPRAHALLDLADGRLRAGDPVAAGAYLSTLDSGFYAFQWRAELRRELLTGRWRLATADAGGAAEAFERVRVSAERLSLRRYRVLARLWLALAEHAGGSAVDGAGRRSPRSGVDSAARFVSRVDSSVVERLASDVDALGTVAPLEAWWLTGELARAFDVDAWRALSWQRAEALAAKAGPYADHLRRAAAP